MVIDASAVVELVTDSDVRDAVIDAIGEQLLDAPEIVFLETTHVCRRMLRSGKIPLDDAFQAIAALKRLDVRSHRHLPLLSRVWELRDRCTAYDASYVALAETLDVPLLTTDAKLARAVANLLPVVVIDRREEVATTP